QALDLLGKIFIDPGDAIAVEAPAYVGALTAFAAYQPRFLTIELDDEGMIVEQRERAIVRGERPTFGYTVPNFGNPAGVTMSRRRREHLVALCRETGIPIIEDNPYGLLRFEDEPLPCLRSLDPRNVIYLGTVSKTFSPGVRVGWALADPSVIQRLILAKEAADLCGSNLTMLLTERWFADEGRWRSALTGLIDTYRARRDAMLDALTEQFPATATWTHPSGGFYVWVTLPPWSDTTAMLAARELEHEAWLVDPAEVAMVETLAERRPDLCWLALHGKEGEDGTVQRLLDLLQIPYTGTAAFDCEVAFDKVLAKDALQRAGVPTPPWVVIEGWALRDLGGGAALGKAVERIGLPCVVKPSRSGAALGMSVVERAGDLLEAVMAALSLSGATLIEAKVEGR